MIENSKLKDKDLLKLQKKFMKDEIKESEIPEEKIDDLKELFLEQIKILEQLIEEDKQKLLKIRKRLVN